MNEQKVILGEFEDELYAEGPEEILKPQELEQL